MKAICSHPRCSNFNQILIFFCFSQSYTSQELWIFEKNCSVQPFCIMCHSIIRAVNDDNEGCLFPAMHTVPKIQTLSKYRYFFVTVKVIHPKYYEYSKKNCSAQPFCIMCHSIIRAVNDNKKGRWFPATHVVPKIQIEIKYYFFLLQSKLYIPSTINICLGQPFRQIKVDWFLTE